MIWVYIVDLFRKENMIKWQSGFFPSDPYAPAFVKSAWKHHFKNIIILRQNHSITMINICEIFWRFLKIVLFKQVSNDNFLLRNMLHHEIY